MIRRHLIVSYCLLTATTPFAIWELLPDMSEAGGTDHLIAPVVADGTRVIVGFCAACGCRELVGACELVGRSNHVGRLNPPLAQIVEWVIEQSSPLRTTQRVSTRASRGSPAT